MASNNSYGSSSGTSGSTLSEEEVRRKYQETLAKNTRALESSFHFSEQDGKAFIFGMEVPPTMKPVIEATIEGVKPFLMSSTDGIFKYTAKFAGSLGFKNPATQRLIGASAETIARWGIIGFKQATDVWQHSRQYMTARKARFETFAPVMRATGANTHNNEVLRVAFDELGDEWMKQMKMVAADLPTLIPLAVMGWRDQVAAPIKRTKVMEELATAHPINPNLTPAEQRAAALEAERLATNARFDTMQKEIDSRRPEFDRKYDYDKQSDQRKEYLDNLFVKTIADPYRENFNKKASEHSVDAAKPKSIDDMPIVKHLFIPVTAVFGALIKTNISEADKKRGKAVKAYKQIAHLENEIKSLSKDNHHSRRNDDDESHARSAKDTRVTGIGAKQGQSLTLNDAILEIFQQHERDREPDKNHLDEHGRFVSPLGQPLVERLQPAIDVIADYIAGSRPDGKKLDASALINLVGGNKIITHGPGGARSFANAEQTERAIAELFPVLGVQEHLSFEEFLTNFINPRLIEQTLRKNLKEMKGEEKALFAALFPDDILEQAGIKRPEINELRKLAQDRLGDFVAQGVVGLAEKSPEKLKALGLNEADIKAVTALAEKMHDGNIEALDKSINGANKRILNAIRTAGLSEQAELGDKGGDLWSKIVEKSKGLRKKIEDSAANKDIQSAEKHGEKQHVKKKFADDETMPASYVDREHKRSEHKPQHGIRPA